MRRFSTLTRTPWGWEIRHWEVDANARVQAFAGSFAWNRVGAWIACRRWRLHGTTEGRLRP